eukprot:m.97205 g.97205  ORF g.97205 m.97205 type:complete len:705 (+) comp26958_c0_seq2:225-2339(+)
MMNACAVFLLLVMPYGVVVSGWELVTTTCESSDSGQQFVFDNVTGQLSTEIATEKMCVKISGTSTTTCNLAGDAVAVLGACDSTDQCSQWTLEKPPHPVSNSSTFFVAPGSPDGQPSCLENPLKEHGGQVDIYCCSGIETNCKGVYPSALPWQQWELPPFGTAGLVKNLAGGLCLSTAPSPAPPPPPMSSAPVFPLPKQLECVASGIASSDLLSSSVIVKLVGAGSMSTIATQAAARYQSVLQAVGTSDGKATVVSITVLSTNDSLTRVTDYAYSVNFSGASVVSASAASPFGVAYALETLVQLARESTCAADGFTVVDHPDFPHRGLMIDTGRRFYSVALVESILEGMAMMKMNVIHMSMSELCFRVESKVFPGLNTAMNCTGPDPRPGLVNNGFYSHADVSSLVMFARARGIRIIPEFDMPGHSGGFCGGLKQYGIVCCGDGGMGVPQIEDDPAGKSFDIVSQVMQEMSTLFPDAVFHIGGDETGTTAPCDMADTKNFEVKMIHFVKENLGKEVMGWEELLFKTNAAGDTPEVIVDSWARSSWQQAATLGHRAVASNSDTFYLDYHTTFAPALWTDIRGGVTNATLLSMLLGGEASMWQDFYVPGARSQAAGSASCLFDDSRDVDFANSTSSTIWPRAAIAGGSFWGYDGGLDRTSSLFVSVLEAVQRRLAAGGVNVCPCATTTAIGCDQNTYCRATWCPHG